MENAISAGSHSADPVTFKTGYMTKQGGRIKTWKRRFFVLDRVNNMLSYYKSETDTAPKGVIHLDGYTIVDDEDPKKAIGFKIEKDLSRTYCFQADDVETKESWKTAITECIEGVAVKQAPNIASSVKSVSMYGEEDDENDTTVCPSRNAPTPKKGNKPAGAGFEKFKVSNDPNATLVLTSDATLAAPGNANTKSVPTSGIANMQINQQVLNSAMNQPAIIPHILLTPHNPYFPTVDRDVLRTLKFGREKESKDTSPVDPDFIGFDSKVVSRKHAEIWTVGDEFYIRDTKSQSGTFLNAMRLSQPHEESKPFKIKNGDIIQFGVDYRQGTTDNTKCVSFKCTLSMRRNPYHNQQLTSQWGGVQSDLTLAPQSDMTLAANYNTPQSDMTLAANYNTSAYSDRTLAPNYVQAHNDATIVPTGYSSAHNDATIVPAGYSSAHNDATIVPAGYSPAPKYTQNYSAHNYGNSDATIVPSANSPAPNHAQSWGGMDACLIPAANSPNMLRMQDLTLIAPSSPSVTHSHQQFPPSPATNVSHLNDLTLV